jgi:hypothetical protein
MGNSRRKESHMTKILKMVRKAKLLVVGALYLLIRSAEAGAATAALLAQAHNLAI